MIHCPYLSGNNRCQVASRMAQCDVSASAEGCNACHSEGNPRGVNVVTIGMAIVQRRRLHKPIAELQNLLESYKPDLPEPATIAISSFRPGPGHELKKMLAWFARPSDECQCETRADTMNDWGPQGCRQRLDTILDWLMEEAQLRELPHGSFTRRIARSLVLTAIGRYERKFPSGPPEPGDEADR